MALFGRHLSRRKFLTRSTLLSGLAGVVAGRLPAFAGAGKRSANPLALANGLSGAGANTGTDMGMRVWAINDSVRVDPIRNQPIVIERAGEKLTNVQVTPAALAGPNGAGISLDHLELFPEWYVPVKKPSQQSYTLGPGWYPDGLLPCLHWSGSLYPHTYVMPFDLPDPLNNVGPQQQSQALWIDVYVPKSRQDAPPGKYTAPIMISSDQGVTQLTLELEVWDFTLPEESHLKPNIYTDTEINTFPEEMELKYYQLLRKHRLSMALEGYAPGLKTSGTQIEIDWSQYDARLAKYLDGSAFTRQYGYRGPGEGEPIEYLLLPFNAYPWNLYKIPRKIQQSGKEWKYYAPWPVAEPREGPTPEYRAIWKNAFQAYQTHFDQHPVWSKTRLLVYFLSLDESYDDLSRDRMFYFGELLKEARTPRLEFRVDGSYSKETTKRLLNILNVANLGVEDCDPATVEQNKEHGVDTWFYENGASIIDGDGLKCRALSWIVWKLGVDTWNIWEMDFNSLRAWLDPETYRPANGKLQNGAGMLVYRGETMGLDEPAASIRLKGMRRGSQDYEYFGLLAQAPGGREVVDAAVRHVVQSSFQREESLGAPGMWIRDPDEWDRVRVRIGDAIVKMPASPVSLAN